MVQKIWIFCCNNQILTCYLWLSCAFYNYFDGPIKLFLDLAKFLDISAKPFFRYTYYVDCLKKYLDHTSIVFFIMIPFKINLKKKIDKFLLSLWEER